MIGFSFCNTRKLASRFFLVFLAFFLSFCLVQTAFAVNEEAAVSEEIVPLEQSSQDIYTERQLQDIVSPSVVRIIQHVEGKALIPSFIIDVENHKISVDKTKKAASLSGISENIVGTGFIISPNGHILTNAHFISDATVKLAIVTPYIEKAVIEAENLTNENIEDDEAFSLEIIDFAIRNSTFELSKEIIVVTPQEKTDDDTESTFSDVSEIGLLANVLYVNDNFYKGDSNLAVIKIEGKDFPSISVTDEKINPEVDNFYTFNSPNSYNFKNLNDLKNRDNYGLEIKKSSVVVDEVDVNILHTNLKLNGQSSGSPSFNFNGEAVGILAFEGGKSEIDESVQMLIIPNSTIKKILNKIGIANEDGTYSIYAKKGFKYINSGSCEEASGEFDLALSSQSIFTKNNNLDSYLTECREEKMLLEKTQTKDVSGMLNTIQVKSTSLDLLDWIIIVLLVLLGVSFLIILIVVLGKIKKKKKEQFYKTSIGGRSEEVQKARRVPLSGELLQQVKEVPIRPVGSDVVLSSDKVISFAKDQDDSLVQKIRLEIKNSDEQQNAITTGEKRYENVSGKEGNSSLLPESLHMLPEEDQKELSELWPSKYSKTSISMEKEPEIKTNLNPELVKYIHEARNFGLNDEKIKQELITAGWGQEDIENAFMETKK